MKGIIKFVLSALLGACIGFVIVGLGIVLFTDLSLAEFLSKMSTLNFGEILWASVASLLFFMLAVFLQIILHEGGHLIFGLATGYQFVSFRILSLTFIRENGRFRIKRFSIAGTGGQCLLSPPDLPVEQLPYFWYNAGGVLVNILTAILALVLWLFFDSFIANIFLFFFFFSGVFLGILNGVPMKIGGITNDGYNIQLIRKDLNSRLRLAHCLAINAEVQKGKRSAEMPAGWFPDNEVMDYSDILQIAERINYASRRMDQHDFETAYTCFEGLMLHSGEMPELYAKEVACELLFLELAGACREEEIERLYTTELQKYVEQYKKVMSAKLRLLCALALFKDKDRSEAEAIYQELVLRKDNYLMQGEVASDLDIMRKLLDRVD